MKKKSRCCKNLFLNCVSVLLLSCGTAGQEGDSGEADTPAPMVVCTFNIRCANDSDTYPDGSSAAWEARKASVKKFLDTVKPDLVGLQEIRKEQSAWFASYSDEYGYFDVSRDSESGASVRSHGGSHEGVGVLYLKKRFELVSTEYFWLDQDIHSLPEAHKDDEGKTVFGIWNSRCRRITLSVVLKDRQHGNSPVYFFPTHYDHKSTEARRNSADLMVGQMKALCKADDLKDADIPVFHLGDLNTASDGGLLESLNDNLYYARTSVAGPDTDTGTYNGFKGKNYIIDHIYYGGKAVKPLKYWVDRTDYGVPFLSDHYPVLFQWEYQ